MPALRSLPTSEFLFSKKLQQKDQTENFYRDMEEVVLKHNCIAYLLQDYNGIGKALATDDNQTMESFSVTIDENLDAYTSLAKFLEQAFEWNVMDYTFYPYYWGNKADWKDMYTTESVDPLFRNFPQAGMARVIVTGLHPTKRCREKNHEKKEENLY